ncbi:hypothetical protein PG991_000456 [Apiospora marii]|uniref:C2H2-type domain-containing protein n=1 Tax=Apiospora marii TaxID=335849 RepID=A0ABR1T4J8_9PEZI
MSASNAFDKALAVFKSELTASEKAQFRFVTSQDVKVAIIGIQAEQRRSKKVINLTRIRGFIEAMEELGKVLEVFLNSSEILAFVWGPMKLLLQTASTWAESLDTLLDAYEQITEHMPILQNYEQLFQTQPQIQAVVEMLWADVLRFHGQALRIFKQRKFRQILDQLQRHRTLLDSQALQVHIQSLHTYRHDREVLLDQEYRQRVDETQRHFLSLMNWISPAESHVDHEQLLSLRECYPGTGDWVLDKPHMKSWIESSIPRSSSLWLYGIPGAGKTVLASTVISSLLQRKSQSVWVAYFYCREMDPARNNTLAILKGLLAQFINQARPFMPVFYEMYIESGHTSLTSTRMTKELLEVMCRYISRAFIVIDGLDECEERQRKESTDFLHAMIRTCDAADPGKLRILYVSRDEPDIRRSMTPATILGLQVEDTQRDIGIYLNAQTKKLREAWCIPGFLSEDDIQYIKRNVQDRADGMFLYAKLVMENLLAQMTVEELVRELEPDCFPTGLQEAYNRTIVRIDRNANASERDAARKVLSWMLCSRRPLYWREIQAAIAMNVVEQTIDAHRKLRRHIRDICGSLIDSLSGDQVQFIHATASFYIAQSGFVSRGAAELSMSTTCMHYLTFECFEDTEHDVLTRAARDGQLAFQDYAIAHWAEHLMNAMTFNAQELENAAKEDFCEALTNFETRFDDDLNFEIKVDTKNVSQTWDMVHSFQALKRILTHAQEVTSWKDDRRDVTSLQSLGTALLRNREVLEQMSAEMSQETQDISQHLDTIYGLNWYKCSRITCFYFHRGFTSAEARKSHSDRHERPFRCTEEDCQGAVFGFQSRSELDKHQVKMHPGQDKLSSTFSRLKKPKAHQRLTKERSSRISKLPAKFQCTLCPKKFPKAYNLRIHLRTHTDERPFACTVCNKSFIRQHDRKRHEALHRPFVCKGNLAAGGRWGCGERFSQATMLGQHLTDPAVSCVWPLLDAQAKDQNFLLYTSGREQDVFLYSLAETMNAEESDHQGKLESGTEETHEASVDMDIDE